MMVTMMIKMMVLMMIPPLISGGAFPAVLMVSQEFAGEAAQSDICLMQVYDAQQY